MTIQMNISHIITLKQIASFLRSTGGFTLQTKSKREVYKWLNRLLTKVRYLKLKKKEKRLVKEFIQKVAGYSDVQTKRLISKHRKGQLVWIKWQRGFPNLYTNADIELLHQVDVAHKLSGKSVKRILEREYEVYNRLEFRRLKNISVAHIYNLRKSKQYHRLGRFFSKTNPTIIPIGLRQKPRPYNKPGFLRVDTVHQGDKNNKKGVYWINMVDEVTQWECVFCVPAITEKFIKPILADITKQFPFRIINFHSDNCSEYINYVVAALLNKLQIRQTKSRARKHNDNALVESKNGSIVRKHFSYFHIPATKKNADLLTKFCIKHLNPYLNFHRPCGFATG